MPNPFKKISLFSRITDQDRMLFAKHLALMSKSGISISESIKVLIQQTKSEAFNAILQGVLKDLENGQSLAKSLARYPRAFNPFYTNIIEIGEASGNFSKNLAYLADQLKRENAFRGKIKSATMYPAIVLCVAIAVAIGVTIFALPPLINMFNSFNVPLPLNTRILIWCAVVLRNDGLAIASVIIAIVIMFVVLMRLPQFRLMWEKLVLKLPVVGPLVENSQLTVLCRNLGVMLQGGVPVTNALDIQARNTENLVYQNYVLGIRAAVGGGRTMTSQFPLGKYIGIPPIFIKMIGIGETSGKLDESFIYLSDFFEAEVDDLMSNISAVLEPILLFIITGIVAFVALSIITPIYQLTGSINPGT